MDERKEGQSSAASSLHSPHSSASQQLTENNFRPSQQDPALERNFQGLSASYEHLTEMYDALKQEKEKEVSGWKRYFEGLVASHEQMIETCNGLREDCRKAVTWQSYFQGISASYQCLTELYATLATDKEKQTLDLQKLQKDYEALQASLNVSLPVPPSPTEPVFPKIKVHKPGMCSPKASHSQISSRKHTPERLRGQEKQKDTLTAQVRQDFELQDLRKQCSHLQSELSIARKDLSRQDEVRKKRDEQMQGLIETLKHREADVARLARELRRKEEVNRNLTTEIQQVGVKVERETRLRLQRELEVAREMAVVKEGEARMAKEMVRNLRKQRDGEIYRFRKMVLSPLDKSPAKPNSRAHSNKRSTEGLNATMPHHKHSLSGDFSNAPVAKGRHGAWERPVEEESGMEELEHSYHLSTKEA